MQTICDTGAITITVNGHADSYTFNSSDTTSTIASHLAQNINADSGAPVTASVSGATVYLTSKATGTAANYSLSSSYSFDTADFSSPSFTTTSSGGTLAGGTNATYQTVYNTGTVKVTVTQGTTSYSKSYNYGQNDTAGTIASNLTSQMHSDTTFPVDASASGAVISLTTRATGTGTGYPLATSAVTTSSNFSSSAFTATPSGANLTSGQNGVVPDSGTVTVTVKTAAGNPYSQTANYGVGSTAAALANSLLVAFNGDSKSPVAASAASGSPTVTLIAKETGAGTNYSVTVSSATSQGTYFSQPSFTGTAASLTGGSDSTFSLSTPVTTTYTDDPFGRALQVTTGQQTQTYVYDGLGRLTSLATPETGGAPVTYSYTDFGAIAQEVDPRLVSGTSTHITKTYAYDTLNRLSTITYNDNVTPNVTYSYNAPNSPNNTGGRLASFSNSVETKAYQYDVMGRITQCLETIGGNQYAVNFGYGADGQITSITYPSLLKITYGYDAIGRIVQLSTPTQNIFSINPGGYNAAGLPVTVPYGNSVTGSFGYNNQLQLSSLQYGKAAPATPLLSFSYLYGGAANNGQIQGITDNVDSTRNTAYQYDLLGRLHLAQTANQTASNSWQLTFTYDIYGNRLGEIPTGGAGSMPSNYVNVDPATNHIQGSGVLYDADGDIVSDGLNNYAFDANHRLTSSSPIPGLSGSSSSFAYGPDGKLVNRNGTVYIYAADQIIAEYPSGASAASPSIQYVNLSGSQVASIAGGATTFIYTDHLSPRLSADSSGNPVRTYGHFPFGETWYETGVASDFKFTSYRRDLNSGLDYANARFYSPRIGRFTSLDPVLGSNRYTYAMNDPINLVDPTGRDAGAPCSLDPFHNFNLPLCGPDQIGNGVGGSNSNCGISFGDNLSFDITVTSNCSSFNVTFNDDRSSGPFGSYSDTLRNILALALPTIWVCPPGGWECPTDGISLFPQPTCDPQFCVLDEQFQQTQQRPEWSMRPNTPCENNAVDTLQREEDEAFKDAKHAWIDSVLGGGVGGCIGGVWFGGIGCPLGAIGGALGGTGVGYYAYKVVYKRGIKRALDHYWDAINQCRYPGNKPNPNGAANR
jgi:RHS repeat-associated protein